MNYNSNGILAVPFATNYWYQTFYIIAVREGNSSKLKDRDLIYGTHLIEEYLADEYLLASGTVNILICLTKLQYTIVQKQLRIIIYFFHNT